MTEYSAMSDTVELSAGVSEEVVTLGSQERLLRGNLVTASPKATRGVLFIHGYGGVRSGPHNLLTHMARSLGKAGIPSIRFDLTGRGESAGRPTDTTLGHMAEDALKAAAHLKKAASVSTLTIVGICSGGNVGIGILDRLPECDALYLLSVYPFGDADSFSRDAKRSVAMAKEYWKKLWLASTWKKVIRGDVQLKVIAGILLRPFRRLGKPRQTESDPAAASRRPLDNLTMRQPRLRMVYGSGDPEYAMSVEYYRRFADDHNVALDLVTMNGANHNFYSTEWKQRISDELIAFIKES